MISSAIALGLASSITSLSRSRRYQPQLECLDLIGTQIELQGVVLNVQLAPGLLYKVCLECGIHLRV
jgi:hypothetical protein